MGHLPVSLQESKREREKQLINPHKEGGDWSDGFIGQGLPEFRDTGVMLSRTYGGSTTLLVLILDIRLTETQANTLFCFKSYQVYVIC